MKQSLLDIKRITNVTTKAIAEHARLPVADVFVVETGVFSSTERAQWVVTAFIQLSGMRVMLEDIRIRRGTSYETRYDLFFSSRRRHTRLQGDWGSDVCSSDLWPQGPWPCRTAASNKGWRRSRGERLPRAACIRPARIERPAPRRCFRPRRRDSR